MQTKKVYPTRILKLNGERRLWEYTAYFETIETVGTKTTQFTMVWEFTLEYFGLAAPEVLKYTLKTKRRLFLNNRGSALQKLSKAQEIALKAACVNDEMHVFVSKQYKFLKVVNTDQIRSKWREIKGELLASYSDLEKMAQNFDKQLQEDQIQHMYLTDNFFNFFFGHIFYKEMAHNQPTKDHKLVKNALGGIGLPIVETKKITQEDVFFQDVTLAIDGILDTESKDFPLDKMNAFLGDLTGEKGATHTLDFKYKGTYEVLPKKGLITQGFLKVCAEIKRMYKKESITTFKLENYEQ